MSKFAVLNGEHQFPVAVANIAECAAKPIGSVAFGISSENLAAALRELASSVEAQEVLVQDVLHIARTKLDDFVMHTVVLKFAATRQQP